MFLWVFGALVFQLVESDQIRKINEEKRKATRNVLSTINSQWIQSVGVEVSLIDDDDGGLVFSFRRLNPLLVVNVSDV